MTRVSFLLRCALLLFPAALRAGVLVPLNAGMQMTCQFVNNSCGTPDNQVYILAIANNASGQTCTLDAAGNMTPCTAGDNGSAHSMTLASLLASGMQLPPTATSGRLYVSYGTPMNMPFVPGVVQPNMNNPSDPNINTTFDWAEFSVINNASWFNTTQVDMFGIPISMRFYTGTSSSYAFNSAAGITESANAIYAAYAANVPAVFQSLAGPHRIMAPIHGSFGSGQPNAAYFDAYINAIWAQYSSTPLVLGAYSGMVDGSGRLAFTKAGDPATYYVSKPTTQEVFGGSGALASGNPTELGLEAQICAAFHRHVLGNAALLGNVGAYYGSGPADYYAQFWHQHSLGALAYGFCYDDVNNQSTTLSASDPRGIIMTIGGGCDLTPTPTFSATPSRTSSATPTNTPSAISTATRTPTPSASPSASPSATPSATATHTTTASPTRTLSGSPSMTSSATLTETPSVTPSASPSGTPSATSTATPTPSSSLTATASPSPSASPSSTATRSASPSSTPTESASPSPIATGTPSVTSSPSLTASSSATPSRTASASPAATLSATASATPLTAATSTPTPLAAGPDPGLSPTPTPVRFMQQVDLVQVHGLYPNPFVDVLNVYFTLRVDAAVTLAIYDVAGEPIRRIQMDGHAGKNLLPWAGINESGGRCASGVYQLRLLAKGVDGTEGSFWARAAAAR